MVQCENTWLQIQMSQLFMKLGLMQVHMWYANFLSWSQGHWNTVLPRCTEILCGVCRLYIGDHKLGFALWMACYVEMCLKLLLKVCILIMKQPNQVHGPLVSCCGLVLVPKHVGIVVVSMVTLKTGLFLFRFYHNIRWWLLDRRWW